MAKHASRKKKSTEPLRFAHPFFTTVPIAERRAHPGIGTRLLDHIAANVNKIPRPRGDSVMALADIIGTAGVAEIEQQGKIRFHAVGDTGRQTDSPQGDVAHAMAKDFEVGHPGKSPAFFFHLGDVIYGHDKDQLYRREFYEPYARYPGKIIAVPGNHDGETFPRTDPKSLKAFRDNFCADSAVVPPIAGTIFRQTMTQPGVFWLLDAPFVQVIGLYSNSAENPGFISGNVPGQIQKTWLVKTLKKIRQARQAGERKALVMATHHPPFSSAGHSGSVEMLADIDDACQQAGLMPDAFLAAHSHTYQRYTRRLTFDQKQLEIPFIVAGCGGINDQDVPDATGEVTGDHSFDKSRKGFGYLLISVDQATLTIELIAVDGTSKAQFEAITVDLSTNRVR